MMRYDRIALTALLALGLAACSGGSPRSVRVKPGCEEATGQGVAPGRASARLVAEAALKHQAHDLRGFMIKDGYHAIRPSAPRVECFAYPLGLGLMQCVARAQLCGN